MKGKKTTSVPQKLQFFYDIDLDKGYNTAPDTQRMREMENISNSTGEVRTDSDVGSVKIGQLVLVPSKKAITKAVRHTGFEDEVEIVPHRFSGTPI